MLCYTALVKEYPPNFNFTLENEPNNLDARFLRMEFIDHMFPKSVVLARNMLVSIVHDAYQHCLGIPGFATAEEIREWKFLSSHDENAKARFHQLKEYVANLYDTSVDEMDSLHVAREKAFDDNEMP
jgi:hypothetical protein